MPPHVWKMDARPVYDALEAKPDGAEASALLLWAKLTVDGLYHLLDLDEPSLVAAKRLGHDDQAVDLAHARWAASSAVTAVDLCSAVLGRVYVNSAPKRECDLGNFDPRSTSKHVVKNRGQLSPEALRWVDATWVDTEYTVLLSVRNALVHSRVLRDLSEKRTILRLDGGLRVEVPEAIETATDIATRRVEAFIAEMKF